MRVGVLWLSPHGEENKLRKDDVTVKASFKASFKTFIVDAAMNLVQGNNRDVVVEAYEKLMDWQWNYISEHGVPFNFIRNRNYIEEINAGNTDVTEPQGEATQEPTAGIQSQGNPSKATLPTIEADKEAWGATITIQADGPVIVAVLATLVVVILAVFIIRKSKKQS